MNPAMPSANRFPIRLRKPYESFAAGTPLLLLMPEEKKEILTIAQHYFVKPPEGLGGNWYMTSLFDKWIEKNLNGVKPEWFKTE